MLGVVTMVPRGVLKALQNRRDFRCAYQFYLILFHLFKLKYVFKMRMLINDISSISF